MEVVLVLRAQHDVPRHSGSANTERQSRVCGPISRAIAGRHDPPGRCRQAIGRNISNGGTPCQDSRTPGSAAEIPTHQERQRNSSHRHRRRWGHPRSFRWPWHCSLQDWRIRLRAQVVDEPIAGEKNCTACNERSCRTPVAQAKNDADRCASTTRRQDPFPRVTSARCRWLAKAPTASARGRRAPALPSPDPLSTTPGRRRLVAIDRSNRR